MLPTEAPHILGTGDSAPFMVLLPSLDDESNSKRETLPPPSEQFDSPVVLGVSTDMPSRRPVTPGLGESHSLAVLPPPRRPGTSQAVLLEVSRVRSGIGSLRSRPGTAPPRPVGRLGKQASPEGHLAVRVEREQRVRGAHANAPLRTDVPAWCARPPARPSARPVVRPSACPLVRSTARPPVHLFFCSPT